MLKTYRVEQRPGHPLQQFADTLAADYFEVMLQGMNAHERSLQELIGPSEIGIPCQRALLHKLAKRPDPRGEATLESGWKPQVGTACHTQQEAWFRKFRAEDVRCEETLYVGNIGPDRIEGHVDLYYNAGAVVDHKFNGATRLKKYKGHGPSIQYRKQAHIYGRGLRLLGDPVHIVAICFIPRDGELKDSYFWWEPYDETIALEAMANANKLYRLMEMFGLEAALDMFPLCQDVDPDEPQFNEDAAWCDWCKPMRNRQQVAATIAGNPFAFSTK